MVEFLQFSVNGLTIGAIYALIAVGFSLVWNARRTLNFAHGAFHMVGAYTAFVVLTAIGNVEASSLPVRIGYLMVAVVASVAVAVVLSGATYLGVYRPLKHASEAAPYIATLGFGIVLAEAVHIRYPSDVTLVPQALPTDRFDLGGVTISYAQTGVLVFALLLMLGLHFLVTRTRTGRAMRAMAADKDSAALMGINTERLFFVVLTVASATALVAGVLVASYFVVINPFLGLAAAIKGLTAAVLGGLGSLTGAVVGGFALGLVEAHSTSLFSGTWKDIVSLLVLVAVLTARPSGLVGSRSAGVAHGAH